MSRRPLAIDLYAGLGGWTEGLLAEGWEVCGFDIERHVYGDAKYPAHLALQDVRTLHGSQFRHADLIVASPPCQEFSYMAMPWTRAKQIARALRGEGDFPEKYKGSRTVPELRALFDACFRLQREAIAAAGRHIPLVVENVKGAQPWVGPAQWHYGSYYLWGDGIKNTGGSWFNIGSPGQKVTNRNPVHDGVKQGGIGGPRSNGKGDSWFEQGAAKHGSKSSARKAASARIAKIPFPLSRWIASVYKQTREVAA